MKSKRHGEFFRFWPNGTKVPAALVRLVKSESSPVPLARMDVFLIIRYIPD